MYCRDLANIIPVILSASEGSPSQRLRTFTFAAFRVGLWELAVILLAFLVPIFINTPSCFATGRSSLQLHSVRGLANGGTNRTSCEGFECFFYNPAAFALSDKPLSELVVVSPQIVVNDTSHDLLLKPNQIKNEGTKDEELIVQHHGDAVFAQAQNFSGIVAKNFAFGMFTLASVEARFFTEPQDLLPQAIGVGATYNGGLLAWYQRFFDERLFIGVSPKFVNKSVKSFVVSSDEATDIALGNQKFDRDKYIFTGQGSGFGADLGIIWCNFYEKLEVRYAAVVANAGSLAYSGSPAPPAEAQKISLEASVRKPIDGHRAILAAALDDVENRSGEVTLKRLHLGLRWQHNPYLTILSGVNQGYASYGLSLGWKFIYIDVARYSEELGRQPGFFQDQRTALHVRLGWVF